MLTLKNKQLHRVGKGQTLESIANAYRLPPKAIVLENSLTGEVFEGQLLRLPKRKGNLYTAKAGESKELLCGSRENYEKKNGKELYPGLKIWL